MAHEAVNGTIGGPKSGVDAVLDHLRASLVLCNDHYAQLGMKRSWADNLLFAPLQSPAQKGDCDHRREQRDPRASVGIYVEPENWNELVDDPDTLVIDTRNSNESAIGRFEGTHRPRTESFRDFPQWAETTLCPLSEKEGSKRIAMFCTGDIRCEKASS